MDISTTRDVPSPQGIVRIWVSFIGVMGRTAAQASPSIKVSTVSLGNRAVVESFGWTRTFCRGNLGATLGVSDPSPSTTTPSPAM